MKDLKAKKKVLEQIMEWADSEMLEDLRSRKAPKALEVAVVAEGKPKKDEELDCEEMPADADKEMDEASGEDDEDIKERLKRLFD